VDAHIEPRPGESLPRRLGQLRNPLDAKDLRAARGQDRRLVARAGADVEHLVALGDLERLHHGGDDQWLRDGLAALDGQSTVGVGLALLCGGDAEAKAAVGGLIARIPNLGWVDAGPLSMARVTERLTAVLVSVNRTYGIREAGFALTGRGGWGQPPERA